MDASRIDTNWQIGKGVIDSLKYIYNNNLWTDITISISWNPEPVRIKAHSLILKSRSPVFEAMLNGSYAESITEEINIQDVHPERFKEMIRYLYCDNVDIYIDNVLGLRNLAKMYMLDNLVALCSDFVDKEMYYSIDRHNIFSLLSEAVSLHQQDAVQQCLRYLTAYLNVDLLQSDELLELHYDAMLTLVKHDALLGYFEHHLFAACIRWAQHQQKMLTSRKSLCSILGNILHNIRFGEMTFEEFTNYANDADGSLLSNEQQLAILIDIGKHNDQTRKRLTEMGFNTVNRIDKLTKDEYQNWTSPVDATYTYNGTEILKIVVTKPVALHAAGILATCFDYSHNMSVSVSVGEETPLCETGYRSDNYCQYTIPDIVVYGFKPIQLNPGLEYTMQCTAPVEDLFQPHRDICPLYYSTSEFERKGHDTSYITITTEQYPAVMERKRYHEIWNLSYVNQLYIQPLDMADIHDHLHR